ncbi:MAG: tetratricopeptide repeat protein [Pseudomonadota bacterium]
MLEDGYGEAVSTASAAARDAYVDGVERFLAASPGVEPAFQSAADADPDFALAQIGLARFRQVMGRGPEIAAPLAAARAAVGLTEREASHVAALGLLLEGRGAEAYPAIRAHLADHPRDAMVAQTCCGVFGLIGFSGRPGREAEQLAFTASLLPHYGEDPWFLGQHAFAEMEAGRHRPAADAIEKALAGAPRNANNAHIRSHLHYETGEAAAGYAYIRDWMAGYDRGGALHTHISWHVALWALEQGDEDALWRVVKADVAPGAASGPPLNVLTDAAAILYRAALAGLTPPPTLWREISAYASRMFPKPGLAFADMHAALAHAMAGEGEALRRLVRDAAGPVADLVRETAEGFGAFAAGRWAEAAAHLTAAMADHARLGGSRAQRDLLEFALAAALLRDGKEVEARRLIALRRPISTPAGAVAGLAA